MCLARSLRKSKTRCVLLSHDHADRDHSESCHASDLHMRNNIHTQPYYDWRTRWLEKFEPTIAAFQDTSMTSYLTTNWTCYFSHKHAQVFQFVPSCSFPCSGSFHETLRDEGYALHAHATQSTIPYFLIRCRQEAARLYLDVSSS